MLYVGVRMYLTNNHFQFQQMKCVKYWPDKGESMAFGDVHISTMSEDHWPDFTIRQLQVTKVCSKSL